MVFKDTLSNISFMSWWSVLIDGRNRSTLRKPLSWRQVVGKLNTKVLMSAIFVNRPLICIFPTLFLKLHVLLGLFSFKEANRSFFRAKLTKIRGLLLSRKLLNQGFLLAKLKSSLNKLYGRHHDLVDLNGISVSQMTTDMFDLS